MDLRRLPPHAPERAPSSTTGNVMSILALVVAVVLLLFVLWTRGDLVFGPATVDPRSITPRGDLAADEQAAIAIFENVSPSVVFVSTLAEPGTRQAMTEGSEPSASGTGFVWDTRGHIVTNYHVIERAHLDGDEIVVTLKDDKMYEAEIVGVAPTKDLAVLRIGAPPHRLKAIALGSSSDLKVGQTVFAIGNPFGLDHTLTRGIVSALGRSFRATTDHRIEGVIQTDAAINPGNSGGPLLDSAGRLIGVNTLIYSRSGTSAGVGFAVPADVVSWVVPELIENGEIKRPGLGVVLAQGVQEWQYRRFHQNVDGAFVTYVEEGSAADRAGIRGDRSLGNRFVPGDVITQIEDVPIRNRLDLLDTLSTRRIGDTVSVEILREGQTLSTLVTLEALGL